MTGFFDGITRAEVEHLAKVNPIPESPLKRLGARLAELLDEDQFNQVEQTYLNPTLAQVMELEAKDRESLITLSQVSDRYEGRIEDLSDALLALLGPDYRTEYECEHGTPLGEKCHARNCHLKPVRAAFKLLPR